MSVGEERVPDPAPTPAAILLAAGLGRRLGGVPKSALRIDGLSLFERLVDALRQSGIDDIGAVIGPYADRLLPLAQRCGVRVVWQGVPDAPLACSQRLAVQEHRARQMPRLQRDLLLLVADLPLLTDADIVPLLHAWRARPPAVQALVPVVDGVRGHPVCLSWEAVSAVDRLPPAQGVRDWLAGAGDAVQRLVTDRVAHVTDLDTPEDLAALRRRLWPRSVDW